MPPHQLTQRKLLVKALKGPFFKAHWLGNDFIDFMTKHHMIGRFAEVCGGITWSNILRKSIPVQDSLKQQVYEDGSPKSPTTASSIEK